MIINTQKLREINNELVTNFLRDNEFGTISRISRATELSISTCRNILNELVKDKIVTELNDSASNGGRPSVKYVFNKNHSYFGIILISTDKNDEIIKSYTVNMAGEAVYEKSLVLKKITIETLMDIVQELTLSKPGIEVITIGIPGVVQDGKVGLCDISSFINTTLKEIIESQFKIKIILENDVNAAALGYYNCNKDDSNNIAYLYYPNLGIPGAGIIVNGEIIKGDSNFAGEVRFLPFEEKFTDLELIQNDLELFSELIVKTILSINSILNPSRVCISWNNLSEEFFNKIENRTISISKHGHLPKLSFNTSLDLDYFNGLKLIGLNELSCKLKVVES